MSHMEGVLDIEQNESVFNDGVVFIWVIYLEGEDSPWIENGTRHSTKGEARREGMKWANSLSISIERETFSLSVKDRRKEARRPRR